MVAHPRCLLKWFSQVGPLSSYISAMNFIAFHPCGRELYLSGIWFRYIHCRVEDLLTTRSQVGDDHSPLISTCVFALILL
eukprot:SAG31_NODE_525_length_14489_cov_3.693815_11_plen_80_part_00